MPVRLSGFQTLSFSLTKIKTSTRTTFAIGFTALDADLCSFSFCVVTAKHFLSAVLFAGSNLLTYTVCQDSLSSEWLSTRLSTGDVNNCCRTRQLSLFHLSLFTR